MLNCQIQRMMNWVLDCNSVRLYHYNLRFCLNLIKPCFCYYATQYPPRVCQDAKHLAKNLESNSSLVKCDDQCSWFLVLALASAAQVRIPRHSAPWERMDFGSRGNPSDGVVLDQV